MENDPKPITREEVVKALETLEAWAAWWHSRGDAPARLSEVESAEADTLEQEG